MRPVARSLVVLGAVVGVVSLVLAALPKGGSHEADGPDGIEIGPETTRLVEPLTPDGRIDYAAALNAVDAPPVADNAAIPLLAILGTDVLVGNRDAVRTLLGAPRDLPAVASFGPEPRAVWSTEPFSELAQPEREEGLRWLERHGATLDALVAASRRPRLWSPVVRDAETTALGSALPLASVARLLGTLKRRAEARLVQAEFPAGWSDIEALLRWEGLFDQQPGLIARLMHVGLRRQVLEAVEGALASGVSDEAFCAQALGRLKTLPDLRGLADDLDRFERFFVLDAFIDQVLGGTQRQGALGRREFVQLNSALRRINLTFDEFVVVLRTPAPGHDAELERRTQEMADSLKELSKDLKTPLGKWRAVLEEQLSGGEYVGAQLGSVVASVALVVVPIHHRTRLACEVERRHVVLALALRLHGLRNGTYPAALDALVPTLLDAVPTNPRDGKPIAYELTPDGCLVGEDADAIALAR